MNINVTIVEDQFLHREYIKTILEDIKVSDVTLNAIEVENFVTFVKSLNKQKIESHDIFLIDIDLNSYFNGVEIAKIIRSYNKNCPIIFITGNDTKALDIINHNILPSAYLIKENKSFKTVRESLTETILHLIHNIISPHSDKYIYLATSHRTEIIKASTINYFASIAKNRYNTLLKAEEEDQILNVTFLNIKKQLEDYPEFKVLKSYIINLKNITSLSTYEKQIIFKNGDTIMLDPRTIKKVKDALF